MDSQLSFLLSAGHKTTHQAHENAYLQACCTDLIFFTFFFNYFILFSLFVCLFQEVHLKLQTEC